MSQFSSDRFVAWKPWSAIQNGTDFDRDSHVNRDGRIDVEAEIAATERRSLAAVEPPEKQLARERDDARARVRNTTGSGDGRWPARVSCGGWRSGRIRSQSRNRKKEAGNQNQADPAVRAS